MNRFCALILIGSVSFVRGSPNLCWGTRDEPTVRGKTAAAWIEILEKDSKVERRRAALIALRILGPKVHGVVPGVVARLTHPARGVRQSAAQVLGQLGADAQHVVSPLATALRADKSDTVREAAARALGRIGPPSKTAVLELAAAL